MRTLIATVLLLAGTFSLQAQPDTRSIHVTTDGQVEVPADRIQFRITINARADTPQEAYDLHQQRESGLVTLLRRHDVVEDQIRYQPISITRNSSRAQYEGPPIQTSQSVTLTLDDFEVFERIQVGLIEAGYDSFSANFTSSKVDSAGNEALRKAVTNAREKAGVLAEEAGLPLGPVLEITYGETSTTYGDQFRMQAEMSLSGNLSDYAQTVVVTRSVSIRYAIGG